MISKGLKFELLSSNTKTLVNHFEFHHEITTKDNLCKNLITHCELNKLNAFNYIPLTFIIKTEEKAYNSDLEKFENCFNLIKKEIELSQDTTEQLENINKKIHKCWYSNDRKAVTYCKPQIPDTHFNSRNIWLLKPTGFNRGRGVSVFDNFDTLLKSISELLEGIEERLPNIKPKEESQENEEAKIVGFIKSKSFVIQKYIEKPLLVFNRKFDIRVWVLVSHAMKVYLFKEGYLRTSCQEYSMSSESISNRSVHLTNNAVQKYCEGYGNYEDGNQLSFQMFQDYLDQACKSSKISVKNDIYPQMKELVILSMQSIRKKLNSNERQFCFELFGYDFIIDSQFKLWLIEVNTNPCLEESSAILKMLLPRLIDDLFKLTLDVIFPKKQKQNVEGEQHQNEKVYEVMGYSNSENLWDYLCQIGSNKNGLSKVKFVTNLSPKKSSEGIENKISNSIDLVKINNELIGN